MSALKKIFLGDFSEVGQNNKKTREEWIVNSISKIKEGENILDAGAGELKYKPYCDHLKYVAQDFGQYDGQGDGAGIQTSSWDNSKLDIVCDIASIPVEDNSFDNILCSEVFEHIPHPVEALKELTRILKTGGNLYITAPFSSMTHFAPYHFYSGFNTYFYEKYLNDLGFDIIEISKNGNYFEFLAQELHYMEHASKKYSDVKLTFKEKLAQRVILSFLKKSTNNDKGSNELLCFGIHIHARKK